MATTSANPYSEDNNIQEPAARLLEDNLGWRSVYAFNAETFGPGSLLGRKNPSETVLVRELDAALARLNPQLAATPQGREQLALAREQLRDADPTKTLLQHNEAHWKRLRDGITLKASSGEARDDVLVKVIDFRQPERNDFLVVRELWVHNGPFKRRCDLVGFVNGLPLVFIEVKRHDKGLKAAFDDNYTDYKDTIPQLFHHNALVIVANGIDARFGSITSGWDHFYRWKRLNEDDADPAPLPNDKPLAPLLPILLRGMCAPGALLDLVENFTLFDSSEEHTVKVVARNHQYLGVNRAVAKLKVGGPAVDEGKLGVFWHTQGSGKSYSMVFFCQKVHRTVSAAYTFVLLTDRVELDTQIYTTFVGCGVSTNQGDKATGADGLEHLLRDQDRRYVFSLIHKFHRRVTAPWTERRDIIVLSDEAHRTQYGRLATQMRMALRHAKFMAFTGTPLIDSRERHETEKVFGAYVSVYDFQRAVADGATLPLYYENRGQKLRLIDPDLNKRIEARIDAAKADGELTEEQEEKLNRELAREYPVFTSDTHLNDVASDFVEHFHQRWRLMEKPAKPNEKPVYGGKAKAMLVCIDKITCAKMAERIRKKWLEKRDALQAQLHQEAERFAQAGKPEPAFVERLRAQVQWMSETQIHPVFSPEQNEVQEFRAEGVDVKPLRQVIANGIGGKKLEDCFKDSEHPFRVAVVCAMWLTGFDVKSLATLYLDKPMKGHTLMQAIARVNRVAAHKKNGLVIDYNGMLKSLREALATYGQGDKGVGGAQVDPLVDEDQALADYAAAIGRVAAHLATVSYALDDLVRAEQGEETWGELLKAQRALSHSPETKKTFQVLAEDVFDRYRGLFPLEGLFEHEPQESAISAVYNLLARPKPKVDITAIMQDIRGVIDTSLDVASHTAQTPKPKQYDLSGIDFERLRAEFAKSPYKEPAVLTLQERIEARLELMMRANPARVNFYERYLKIISEFNRDKDDAEIQRVFEDLLRLHDSLDSEELRYLREGFTSDKELAVFDLLSKDKADIQKADIDKLKKVAKELMATIDLRRQEMGELRDRASAQARMKATIIDHLLQGLPDDYSSEDIEARADTVYQYVQAQVHSQGVH
ncbi:MAG: HsdR family type I site-specific deoxyribonuclease [Hydrogenophaga sp.]|jgi:type I restriction enzyme R subunit|nr:HsdR family type I site-specific deoxyribonuclease [Hydrogenophaga sp.]